MVEKISEFPTLQASLSALNERLTSDLGNKPSDPKAERRDSKANMRRALADAANQSNVQALHPKYQKRREKNAIIDDPRLKEILEDAEILKIKKVTNGYLIQTKDAKLFVEVKYLPPVNLGPARFELIFHELESLAQVEAG